MDPNILSLSTKVAVIGSSNNETKYGFRIYRDLKEKGFTVYPVNNREDQIQGDKAFHSIDELPEKVDIIDLVVPPEIAFEIAKHAEEQGYKTIWFQPGSESHEAREYFENSKSTVIFDRCIMIESDRLLTDSE